MNNIPYTSARFYLVTDRRNNRKLTIHDQLTGRDHFSSGVSTKDRKRIVEWLNERDAGYPVPKSLQHMLGGNDDTGKAARSRNRRPRTGK